MSNLEKSALRESNKSTDGGFGFADMLSGCMEDMLKDFRKAQCDFLSAVPAEFPKAEVKSDAKGSQFLEFAALTDKDSQDKQKNFDQWLDGKTKLRPLAA